MRVLGALLGGLILVCGVAAYGFYAWLQTGTVAIEAAPQPVVGADGGPCETTTFTVGSRRLGKFYLRTGEGQTISGRYAVRGSSRHDVILRAYSPQNRFLLDGGKKHELDFTVPAQIRGDYLFQFDNRFSIFTDKIIDLTYCLR